MNPKIMVRVLFAALFIFTCFVLAGIVRAETTTQFVVEGESLVVRETEVTVIKVEKFLMPPNVDIPEKDLPKIHAILEQGKGEYMLGTAEVHEWQFGIPMKKITQTVDDVISLSNGTWLWHGVIGAPKSETNWFLTLAIVAVIAVIMITTRVHQKSGKSERWLLVFYGALIMAAVGISINTDNFIISILTMLAAVVIALEIGIGFPCATMAAIVLSVVIGAFIGTGQQVELAVFMAFAIACSYGGAKLAKYCRPNPRIRRRPNPHVCMYA